MYNSDNERQFRKHLTVPLCRVECVMPHSPLNKHLQRWIFMDAQKNQSDEAKSDKEHPTDPILMFNQLAGIAPPPPTVSDNQPSHVSNVPYKRISPEFLELVQLHKVDDTPLKRASRVRLTFTAVGGGNNQQQLTPSLASHLRNVMDERDIHTYLYGIDFSSSDGEMKDDDDKFKYLDRKVIEHLFRIIKLDGKLNSEQTRFLLNFLEALADLTPTQITTYFAILRANGVLTVAVLDYLNELLKRTGTTLYPQQMKMLLNVLNIMAEAAIRGQRKLELMTPTEKREATRKIRRNAEQLLGAHFAAEIPGIAYIAGPAGAMYADQSYQAEDEEYGTQLHDDLFMMKKTERKERLTAEMAQSERLITGDELYSDAAFAFDIETDILKGMIEPEDMDRRQTFLDKSYPRRKQHALSFYSFPMHRRHADQDGGYYRPWDVQLPWRGFQKFFQRALEKRMSRLDLTQFPYARGLERYSREFKERKQLAEELTTQESDETPKLKRKLSTWSVRRAKDRRSSKRRSTKKASTKRESASKS